jgi:predicted Zn-dependent protease
MRVSDVIALSGVVLCACATNPATGKPVLSLISNDQEVQMGKQAVQDVKQSIGLVDDAKLQDYVARMGKEMAAKSERANLPWYFAVVDDASVNAFALPGGQIFVTRGLCAHADNAAQLATVIGHEIGHVTARHSVQRMSQQELISLGLGVGMVVSAKARQFEPLASAGLSVLFLKFSRNDEYQADQLGVRYASRSNYDVRQMPDMFRMLERVSNESGGGRLPEWLSTHPEPEHRIERVTDEIAKTAQAEGKARVERDEYLKQLDGLVYGVDPREGFVRGDRFYQPRMRFSIQVPDGWKTQNTRDALIMASGDQGAMIQLTAGQRQDPQEALGALERQEGVKLGKREKDVVPKLDSAAAELTIESEETGPLAGLVTYVTLGDHTYQVLGLAKPEVAKDHMSEFDEVRSSFESVSDRNVLKAEPARIAVFEAPDDTTLEALYSQEPASIPLDRLALLNQMQPKTPLQKGMLVKWVRGGSGEVPEESD